jgi:hypothetical protein
MPMPAVTESSRPGTQLSSNGTTHLRHEPLGDSPMGTASLGA